MHRGASNLSARRDRKVTPFQFCRVASEYFHWRFHAGACYSIRHDYRPMKIPRLVLLSCALMLAEAVHAQPGQMGTAMFGGSMARLFGDNSAFSADTEIQTTGGGNQNMTMPGKLTFDSGKSRFEMSSSNARGNERMKAMGMDKTVIISRSDTKTAYLIYPGLSAYAPTPLQDANATKPASSFKVESKELGKDTVDSHECVKNKVVVTDDQGKAHEFTTWNATDLNKFPVKIEMNEQGHEMTMLFKNVKISKPDAALFEPPADYKKYDSPQALMQQEIMKRMGTMPPGHQ